MNRYEQWLVRKSTAINEQIKYYETAITKLKKQKKVIQLRTVRQNNNQMTSQSWQDA